MAIVKTSKNKKNNSIVNIACPSIKLMLPIAPKIIVIIAVTIEASTRKTIPANSHRVIFSVFNLVPILFPPLFKYNYI